MERALFTGTKAENEFTKTLQNETATYSTGALKTGGNEFFELETSDVEEFTFIYAEGTYEQKYFKLTYLVDEKILTLVIVDRL